MKIEIDKIPIEFCSTILSVAQKIPESSLLYWARNEEELTELLIKKDFQPITTITATSIDIPELPEKTRGVLWRKRFMDSDYLPEFVKHISSKLPGTLEAKAHPYAINVALRKKELFKELEIEHFDDLKPVAFTYTQIAWLLSRHTGTHSKRAPVLEYSTDHCSPMNYFPMVSLSGEIVFAAFYSRREFRRHKNWRGWFIEGECSFNKGRLILKEDIAIEKQTR